MISKIYSFKNTLFQKEKIIWLILIAIGVLTMPFPYYIPLPQLDSGGIAGLYLTAMKHLQIVQDVNLHFGPLGFMYEPAVLEPHLYFITVVFRLLSHSFFFFAIGLFLVKLSVSWKQVLVLTTLPVLAMVPWIIAANDYVVLFASLILLYLIIIQKIDTRYHIFILSVVSFLLAIESLTKFNMTVGSFSLIIIFSIISIINKQYRKPLILCISYIVFLLTLWLVSGQHLANFPLYFIDSSEFSEGYNAAQAIDGPKFQLVEALIGIILTVILLIFSLMKKDRNLLVFIFLNSALLFMTFKHGFVRQDAHVINFFYYYGLFFILSYIIHSKSNKKYQNKRVLEISLVVLSIIFVVNIIPYPPPTLWPNMLDTIPPYGVVLPMTFDQSFQDQMIKDTKSRSINFYNLDNETINNIGNKSMDVIPWDVMVAYAYNFNWSPRPMWFSFNVFSEKQDIANAEHFSDAKIFPNTILYSYKSTDDRYPLFDEPQTFAAILQNYEYNHTSGEFLLLSHTNKEKWTSKEDLGTIKAEIGKPIKIPKYDKGYLFAKVKLKYNTFGKFSEIIYKPAQAHIKFNISDQGYSQQYRFLPGTANGGIFVSQYVQNIYDLRSIFSGKITPNIDEMIISVGDPTQYEKNIQVEFVGMPALVSIQKSNENEIPNWNKLKLVQGGMMSIDWIDDKLFANEKNIVNINNNEKQFIQIKGWSVDDLAKDGNVKTFLVFQNKENKIVLPTVKTYRPDLVSVFGIGSYVYAGWQTILDTEKFEKGCYAVYLQIPRTNLQEYFEINSGKSICFG